MSAFIIPTAIVGGIILLLLILFSSGYVKAPPDTAYIISGNKKKIVVGRAAVKIPFLQRLDKLTLKLIPIDVKTSSTVPTADYIDISVDAIVNVKVSSKPELLAKADLVVFLPMYLGSGGCEVEDHIAQQYHIPRMYINYGMDLNGEYNDIHLLK